MQVRLYYRKNCKAMMYWQDMKNFVEQISMKFGDFYAIEMNLVQIVLPTSTTKYRWEFVYRLIISVGL